MADDGQRKEECSCPPAGAPKWVVTFGDMMSLLLTFFVLLLSFAEMNVVKYQKMVGSLREAFGVSRNEDIQAFNAGREIMDNKMQFDPNFMSLVSMRANATKKAKKRSKIELESAADWARIKVPSDALFASGSYELLDTARPILDDISDLINPFEGTIMIEGHTDNAVPGDGSYLDNYLLGFRRANAVLGYLVRERKVDRKKLVPTSLADTVPRETNDIPQGRARNRRVEFVFMGKLDDKLPGERLRP